MPSNSAKIHVLWGIESMLRAVKAVRDKKKMGLLKASKVFSVPTATLKETGIILVSTVSAV
jgi:hypothetical protein